jgi:hypothetical protein
MSDQSNHVLTVSKTLLSDQPDNSPEARVSGPQKGAMIDDRTWRRIKRGEAVIERHDARWRELWAHFDGDQYVERSVAASRTLVRAETREGGTKPRWRSRLVRNRFTKAISGEVSVVASRTPAWEVTPPSEDRAKRNKARLGEKVLLSLWQKLRMRNVVFRVCQVSAVTGDGFLFPYWDPTKGKRILEDVAPVSPDQSAAPASNPQAAGPVSPYGGGAGVKPYGSGPPSVPNGYPSPAPSSNGATKAYRGKRTGDISMKVLRQDQVLWQPHQAFDESLWWCIRDAQPLDDVKEEVRLELGQEAADKITSDASASVLDVADGDGKQDLVFKYHFFERPCDSYPDGRYLEIVNKRVVCEPYPYPLRDNIPCIHRMPWIVRENRDRSLGLGELAIDIQRSINRLINQIITWRNLVLNPQLVARAGSIKTVVTEEPGKVIEYRGPTEPRWREIQEIPSSLFRDLEQAYADMDYVVGSGAGLPPGVEAGSAIQALNEREQSFRAQIIANLAVFYSGLGRHLLCLVRQHYTEERLLVYNGRFGVDMIADFLGEQLGEEDFADVRVSESSITPHTRAEMEAKIMMFADKQWIPPQMAMAALQGGTAEVILDRFERDEAKAHRHISALILIGQGMLDPDLVPSAGPQDNHAVQADTLKEWMKTTDFEEQHELVQIMAYALIQQHELMAQGQLDKEAARQQMRAVANGQANAAAPQPVTTAAGANMAPDQPGPAPTPQPSRPSLQNETQALAGAGT